MLNFELLDFSNVSAIFLATARFCCPWSRLILFSILPKSHIENPVQFIFHLPVCSHNRCKL